MSDRELLEKAAKAAGWTGWQSKHGYWNLTDPDGEAHACCNGWDRYDSSTGEALPGPTMADALLEAGWNPLTDDGDALRLAVKLYLWEALRTGHRLITNQLDVYAATRLAIVRAAASIGESATGGLKEKDG